jgi:hypothetical protein
MHPPRLSGGFFNRRDAMRKLITAAAALCILGATAPALAQSMAYSDRSDRLEDRINTAERVGDITVGQAASLRDRLRDVERLENAYRDDGLTSSDVRDLDRRYDAISRDLSVSRDDTQYRYRRDWDWRY